MAIAEKASHRINAVKYEDGTVAFELGIAKSNAPTTFRIPVNVGGMGAISEPMADGKSTIALTVYDKPGVPIVGATY